MFFLFSLILHAGFLWIFAYPSRKSDAPEKTPVFVDVIFMPGTGAGVSKEPEKAKIFAGGSRSVEKESIPSLPGRGGIKWSAPARLTEFQGGRNQQKGNPYASEPSGKIPGEGGKGEGAVTNAGKGGEGGVGGVWGAGEGGAGSNAGKAGSMGFGGGGVNKGTGLRLFPTQERIAQLEEKYEKEPHKGEAGKVLALNTSEIKYYNYLFSMKQRIETYWDYPSSSVRNREQGRLSVDFTITRDGGVEGIKIVKSSSYPALDDAAITAIRLATPFSPFPPEFDLEKVNIHARFEYQIFSQFSH